MISICAIFARAADDNALIRKFYSGGIYSAKCGGVTKHMLYWEGCGLFVHIRGSADFCTFLLLVGVLAVQQLYVGAHKSLSRA